MIRLISLALRALLVLLVVRLAARFFAGVVRGYRGQDAGAGARPRAGAAAGELVRDAVCNTFVPRATALQALVAGETRYFCSAACRDMALVADRRAS